MPNHLLPFSFSKTDTFPENAYMGHSFTYRTDLKRKLLTFLKVLNYFLMHLFINLIDTFKESRKFYKK